MPCRAPEPPPCLPTGELYTPANIAKALRSDLTSPASSGVSSRCLAELRTVQRLHAEIEELARRIPYGLTLRPEDRRWSRLLVGPLLVLRGTMGAAEAAPFFVRHAVRPAALAPNVTPQARRVFLREMRALPFSEQGKPLGEFPDAAELLNLDTTPHPSTPPNPNPCHASKSKTPSPVLPGYNQPPAPSP